MPAGPVRLAVAGHAECDAPCADLAPQSIGPDRTLAAALRTRRRRCGAAAGPRALLYTGNRVESGLDPADGARYAELLGSAAGPAGLPGARLRRRRRRHRAPGPSSRPSPASRRRFGSGPAPAGISTAGIPGAAPGARRPHPLRLRQQRARGHRARGRDRQLARLAGRERSAPEPARGAAALAAKRCSPTPARRASPSIVMGNRSLNTSFTPKLNVAADGDQVAQALVDGGASAYLFDRPEENRSMRIPAGAATTIPSFGTGTLGYRSQISGAVGLETPDALFGDSGVLVLEIDAIQRDPATNRAPVGVRLIPVIEDLSLEATDGTLLRRSRPALFRGLGRRPRGGDRWGRASAGTGNPEPVRRRSLHAVPARPVPGAPAAPPGSTPSTASPPRTPTSPTSSARTRPRPTCASPSSTPTTRSSPTTPRACSARSTPARRRSPSAPAATPTPNR